MHIFIWRIRYTWSKSNFFRKKYFLAPSRECTSNETSDGWEIQFSAVNSLLYESVPSHKIQLNSMWLCGEKNGPMVFDSWSREKVAHLRSRGFYFTRPADRNSTWGPFLTPISLKSHFFFEGSFIDFSRKAGMSLWPDR